MPSGYAHLRFGNEAFASLPKDASGLICRFRQLYNVGLQGPDLFFYYNPVAHSQMGALGSRFHMRSGKEFFGNAVRKLRCTPSDAAQAYLFGVLGHYCLDSACHPYVNGISDQGRIGHTEMETEFDRFLLAKDGIAKPHRYSIHPHLRLNREECTAAAVFYRPATAQTIGRCSRNMVWVNRMLAMKPRFLAKAAMEMGGKVGREMLMHEVPNGNCVGTNEALLALYQQALERYPRLMEQLLQAITCGAELGEDFEPCFG